MLSVQVALQVRPKRTSTPLRLDWPLRNSGSASLISISNSSSWSSSSSCSTPCIAYVRGVRTAHMQSKQAIDVHNEPGAAERYQHLRCEGMRL